MTDYTRARGLPRRPARYRGVEYPSLRALAAATQTSWRDVYARIERGDIELLEAPPAPNAASGAAGAAHRIQRAAHEIRQIAKAQADEGHGTKVEIEKRRYSLVKALHLYRRRYGHGVMEATC